MHVQTHLAASWILGSALPERRDRRIIAWAGVLPDLDSLAIVWGAEAYGRWHHVVTHGLLAGVVVTLFAAAFGRMRVKVAILAFAAFHLHLIADLVGSGVGWTIVYLYPFSSWELGLTWGWELASWQNFVATLAFFAYSVRSAVVWRRSFVEACAPVVVDSAFCGLVSRTWARLGRTFSY